MSDEARTLQLPPERRTSPGMFEHFCEHPGCKKWGGWGFARGKDTEWYCYEHRGDGER